MSHPEPSVPTGHDLGDGWTVRVSVPVEEEIGYNGGHTSGSRGFFWAREMSDEDVIAAIDAQYAKDLEDLARTGRFQLRVARDAFDVLVMDEERRMSGPQAELLWPPVVTDRGVVLRWARETTSTARDDGGEAAPGEAPLTIGTEIQRPWFVAADGTVSQLPFELAVRPLGAGADGRLLLPSCHPLWWDGEDESFTWIDLAGTTEPLLVDGEPVTVSRICTAIGEPYRNGLADREDGRTFWEPVQGRLTGDELTVRLKGDAADDAPGASPWSYVWVTVGFSLTGPWDVRVVERGSGDDDEVLPPL